MTDEFAGVIEATDSWWAIGALCVIGIYVLLWRWGGELLRLARENNQAALSAAAGTEKIVGDIVTNHGSRNLGDAVDRLTSLVMQLQLDLTTQIHEYRLSAAQGTVAIDSIENRLKVLEARVEALS